MKCEFCQEEMQKTVDENMGISYECLNCGHVVDIYYKKGNDHVNFFTGY